MKLDIPPFITELRIAMGQPPLPPPLCAACLRFRATRGYRHCLWCFKKLTNVGRWVPGLSKRDRDRDRVKGVPSPGKAQSATK